MTNAAVLRAIYRYPVKGLSAEQLATAALRPRQTIAGDRRYAIENGASGFDPAAPAYLPKQRFLMLMKNARLARLRTRLDAPTNELEILEDGAERARGDLGSPAGRAAIEAFFTQFCADELRGPPKVLAAAGHSFSDVARKVVSIINLASVAAVAQLVGGPVDPLRFRGNLYVEGWPAWREFDSRPEIAIGGARSRQGRQAHRALRRHQCGPRDRPARLHIPPTLMQALGHADCGIYAEVTAAGDIAAGRRRSLVRAG